MSIDDSSLKNASDFVVEESFDDEKKNLSINIHLYINQNKLTKKPTAIKKQMENFRGPRTIILADENTGTSAYVEDMKNMTPSPTLGSSLVESGSFRNRSFHNSIKKCCADDFGLEEKQFETVKSCFDRLRKRDDCINKYIFKEYICDQVKERAQVVIASDKDLDRVIEAIDSDGDGEINFNEYLDFLFLFFSRRQNVRRRIMNVLNGRSQSLKKKGTLNESEIVSFAMFLKFFYGAKGDLNLHARRAKNIDRMTYKEFANWVFPIIKGYVFVK